MGEQMPLICLSYDPRDDALATRLADALRGRGATVLSEPAVDLERSDLERADGVAARAKASDLVVTLAGADEESQAQAQRALRAATAYRRRLMVGLLEPEASLDAIAWAPARDTEELDRNASPRAPRSFDLFAKDLSDKDGSARYGGYGFDEVAIDKFIEEAERAAKLGAEERASRFVDAEDGEIDGFGFPRTPAAMLARWRLVEPHGRLEELESFLSDYSDDPYFAVRAAGAVRAARRRAARQRGYWGYHATMGALLALGVLALGFQVCGPAGCSLGDGLDRIGASSAFDITDTPTPRDTAAISIPAAPGDDGGAEARRLRAQLAQARARLNQETAAAERRGDDLRAQIAELRADLNDVRVERDQLRRAAAVTGGADAGDRSAELARLRASDLAGQRALANSQDQVEDLEGEIARLRASLNTAASERDRFESAAKDRAAELAALRARAGPNGADAAAVAQLEREIAVGRATLSSVRSNLRELEIENDNLRASLEDAEAENRALLASATRPGAEPGRVAALSTPPRLTTPGAGTAVPAVRPSSPPRRTAPPRVTRRTPAPRPSVSSSGADASGSSSSGSATTSGPILRVTPADKSAVERVLRTMREELAKPGAPRAVGARRPPLTRAGVRVVQRCLRSGAGQRIAADGVWGRRTTSALLSVRGGQAATVSRCLRRNLRR